ncbi:zf-HC2 domain-containing protein [Streptomyces roseicoloratus]|uniref:zf-HC2 domain-containing protein n=1 Tax=Streptomyces roseicoloratus TaxID=2508722 RepID=UPI0010098C1B|nr:zf-HC2 domain-containing protein [Streptomyces roseicoloratus]
MSGAECERLRERVAELALGVLPARERAEAVAHLDGCPDCRRRVRELTAVGDGLLGLLPQAEPPVGFETRVVRAVAPEPPAPRRAGRFRGRRLRLAAAAVAGALAFGFGGWAVGTAVQGPPTVAERTDGNRLREAALLAGGHEVGRLWAHAGAGGGWVYMAVDLDRAADGPVRCVLVGDDGSTTPVGSFPLEGGYGYWGAPVTGVDPGAVTGARLLAQDGTVLAEARFDDAASGT